MTIADVLRAMAAFVGPIVGAGLVALGASASSSVKSRREMQAEHDAMAQRIADLEADPGMKEQQ